MHRREFVAILGVGGALAIAGCSDDDDVDAGIAGETLTLTTTRPVWGAVRRADVEGDCDADRWRPGVAARYGYE